MSYLYVPGMEDSTWDSDSQFQTLERCCSWRGKPRALRSWKRGCARATWIKRLSGRISAPSTASRGVESWIASLRESRASRGLSPARSAASTTSDTSAKSSFGSLARWDRTSSSWKTCQASFGWDSPTFLGDWPNSGSMRSGACSPARESVPLIDGSASSCWPIGGAWPTPRTITGGAESAERKKELGRTASGGGDIQAAAQNWPTPDTGCHKGSSQVGQRRGQLDEAAEQKWPSPPLAPQVPQGTGPASPSGATRRRLNPTFVEWLMGLPAGWTASECLATAWTRWWALMRSALLQGESYD
jgi:hypothetical protein